MNIFIIPTTISVVALVAVYWWGGMGALLLALLVSALEITLSFDNAVVNAKVLGKMDAVWQKRFLTWGILFAVFGTRLVLPAIIVGFAAWISPLAAILLAVNEPGQYALLLEEAAPVISSFGGAFLLMVSLKYFFDVGKDIHWIAGVEKRLARWGRIEAIELALAISTVLGLSYFAHEAQGSVLAAGCVGIILFIVIQGIANAFQTEDTKHSGKGVGKAIATTGFALFAYLNVLDAAFSLDGVIGAFALTTAIPIIFAGLGIGAFFVRTITVFLVQKKTLDTLVYLEHGAHWAILGLALSMLASLMIHIPEAITGLIGLVFVTLAYVSSVREKKRSQGV